MELDPEAQVKYVKISLGGRNMFSMILMKKDFKKLSPFSNLKVSQKLKFMIYHPTLRPACSLIYFFPL
jgi:hypothetical protein